MPEPLLSILVVTHQSARWLPGLFDSWQAALEKAPDLRSAGGVELIVSDAASTDGTADIARAHGAAVLAGPNAGFGAAANAAARLARAPWLLLCNPDITFGPFFAERWLFPLVRGRGAYRPGPGRAAACIAPRLLNPDGSLQPSVGPFPSLVSLVRDQFRPRENRKYRLPQPDRDGRIDWATAACLLLWREAFLGLGGFDERYFLYMEEVDLQRRFFNAGFESWFVAPPMGSPEAAIIHHHPHAARKPSPEVATWSARGLLRYFAKFHPLALPFYRLMALAARRLPASELFASRASILARPTGP